MSQATGTGMRGAPETPAIAAPESSVAEVLELGITVHRLAKRFAVRTTRSSLLGTLRSAARGVSLAQPKWVLRDVSFEIRRGEKVALVGRNGCGKTTLLRILCGISDASSGELRVRGAVGALFDAAVGVLGDLPVVDNIFLFGATHGIARAALAGEVDAILAQADLAPLRYAPYRDLSLGQRQRFALAVFAQSASDIVIFDEALANVDAGFLETTQRWFEALAATDRTVIVTSHSAALLGRACSRAIWLDEGRVRLDGPVDAVLEAYGQALQAAEAA